MAESGTLIVRYFAAAAEAAGRDEETVEFTGTVASLKELLVELHGASMERVLRAGSFLIGGVVSRDDTLPVAGRVDVLPPFAGG
ncbi:MoaD/ThiS family protein [Curtobacterium sp. ISL-83]|uniref:MoaD/ThiS family protein n=1 Tax=Curtobacterium sp. ISL-83 TaxID=2819145 RepID=UPI001BE64867|nr:MoaD/ThiS family protein [Curtobacterium sp. ISL-83]MBT2502860.1 MoaD/ThiS family protein [Curtobacterium sp. ISL-83]